MYRGRALDAPVALIAAGLPGDARRYLDTAFQPTGDNYYIVHAVDTAGNRAASDHAYGMVWDTIRPAAPTGLAAGVDSAGVVRLRWSASPEADVIGYKVLTADSLEHEFSLLTGTHLRATTFVDTIELRTTTPYVYYRVLAVDHRFNYSELSEPLAVRRPDVLPPNSPVWRRYEVTDSAIELAWSPSRSADVIEHRLYRRADGAPEELLATLGVSAAAYRDTALVAGRGYAYRIAAVDDVGHVSAPTQPVYLEAPRLAPKPLAVELTIVDADGVPELRWSLVDTPAAEVARAEVFRMGEGGALRRLGSLPGGQASYVDHSAAEGGRS